MKIHNKVMKHIILTLALVLMVVGSPRTTKAQNLKVLKGTTLISFIPGQTLRFSIANLSTPQEGSQMVCAQVTLYDAQGTVLASSRKVGVLPSQFRTFDFTRDDLLIAGEPGTGRLQVRADVQVQVDTQQVIPSNRFPVTVEVFDRSGGPYSTGYVKVSDD
jgi:hypothetical protein